MRKLFFTTILSISTGILFAQINYRASNTSIKMEGTSTLHDWHMTSQEGLSNVIFNFNGSSLTSIPSLTFTVQVETLKSGTKGLNKNAYKALNVEKFPTITFSSHQASIRANGANTYVVSAKGKLTISGVSKDVSLAVTCKVNSDLSVQANGSCNLKMSEYKVEAPSFMFGAMKTGDDVSIHFNALLKK